MDPTVPLPLFRVSVANLSTSLPDVQVREAIQIRTRGKKTLNRDWGNKIYQSYNPIHYTRTDCMTVRDRRSCGEVQNKDIYEVKLLVFDCDKMNLTMLLISFNISFQSVACLLYLNEFHPTSDHGTHFLYCGLIHFITCVIICPTWSDCFSICDKQWPDKKKGDVLLCTLTVVGLDIGVSTSSDVA